MAEKKSDKQVMDVSKPGKSAADASARPVIVGHKPQVQDPMVNTAEDTNPDVAQEEPATASPTASKKVIAPLSEQEEPVEPEAPAPEAPTVDAVEKTTTEQPTPQDNEPPEADEESSDAAVVDAVAEQVGSKKKEDVQSEEDKKRQAELDKLILEKKYFVSIGSTRSKSNRRILFVTLLLLLVLAGLILAVDAEVLEVGLALPFDLIPTR
jgi:hypothetical protein